MAATCLDRCRGDDTSVRLHITCPDEHILYSLKPHENPKLQMIPEKSLNKEKPEERRFKSVSFCKFLKRHLGRSKFAIQERTERPRTVFGERVERSNNSFKKRIRTSKSSLKKRIGASKDMMSQLGERIHECSVKAVTKLRHVCGRKRGMYSILLRVWIIWS